MPTDAAELERAGPDGHVAEPGHTSPAAPARGATMRHNREAFERWRIVPRMLHGITTRDLSTTVLGTPLPAPLLLAPVGAGALVRRGSDVHIARARRPRRRAVHLLQPGLQPDGGHRGRDGRPPSWFQLYWSIDEPLVDSMIRRAEACGARALVVTLDTTMLGWRPQDLDLGSLPFAQGMGIAQYTSDPRFREIVRERLAAAAPGGQEARSPSAPPHPALDQPRTSRRRSRANLRSPEPGRRSRRSSTSTPTPG